MNYARSAWELQAKREEGEQALTIGLFHRKVNEGAFHKPLGMTFTFGLEGTKVGKSDPYSDPTLAQGGSLTTRLRLELKHGSKTAKVLASDLQKRENEIRARLSENPKFFLHLEDGSWGLRE